ncbi:Adenylate and Guanylate cyclase catalytic domain containing protein [Trichomonas vaginalis G3]|uniref:Adenylate and Guanylate cyclase catalytic domain containing protein n=1 Tax=Trichomonas vaginalis (strain ATCC PRA-98 / G3) TaxID=412133 RepID=A2FPM7_TRIV3|nr:guanylate cyclase protein [Trichomonas vaginalis G3]EAX93151.1 Adenylate and Guanylate cyclase catalytic domain containing protein [Trichomonas vaginalis G3]KAI5502011.1 guanylate cyclase protein [Trichomonas vaginalis G3]|eukprot:XP_001306081.1 Adenylate and Guanylate cyclase catalytic domain containing protein [Trichomonas vaginalis G3]
MYDDINSKNKIFFWCIIGVAIFLLLVFVAIIAISWKRLNNDKTAIYKTLMSLPKNVVSSINENLRQLQKNTDLGGTKTQQSEGERNKQEENLLKIFVTASDSSGTVGDFAQLAIAFVFIMLCSIAYTTILFLLYEKIGTLIKENAPQANNMFGTASYITLLALSVNQIIGVANGHPAVESDFILGLTTQANTVLQTMYVYYNKIRFGDGESLPFPHFETLATKAIENAGCNITKPPANLTEVLACYSPDIIVRYLSPLMHRIVDPINATSGLIKASDRQDVFWVLTAYRLFDDFFYPGAQQISSSLDSGINHEITFSGILTLVFIILILITIGVIIYKLHMIDKKLRFTLGLLLSCNPSTVMQNSQIVSILTGNFSKTSTDTATRDAQFYKLLVQDMQDSVIVTNQQFEIVSWNKASSAIFDVDFTKNNNFQQLLTSSEFSGDVTALFDATSKTGKTEIKYNHKNDTKVLNIQANSFGSNVVFTTQNVTQNFMYNKLIAEERAKSDTLLASILPASLVPRVQRGEKNISFAVPSASVVFIDIVEFTPWCGSNDAKTVMGTLNIIFQYFDAIVNSQQVMQRMKCIGDCYMAAGGIFAEVSNAVQNAKEAVDFGLQALDAVERVDKEQNQKLRIRVGVNVGGPLVAGVLGTEKPTFEIFGPVIVMAQQMEHNGVPMKVHISRAVYELIYGGQYKIEERGEIQIKQGRVVTYLVSR